MKLPELESVEVVTGPHGETTIQRFYESGGVHEDTFDALTAEVLRNHFQRERDRELGRWRDPKNPDMVCYPVVGDLDAVWVVYEGDGPRYHATRTDWERKRPQYVSETAGRYFQAHPEPHPWEAAQPDEVWVLTIDGYSAPYLRNGYGTWTNSTSDVSVGNGTITAGRRIWPEGDDQ